MIRGEELYHRLHQQPFQAFRVHLKEGQSYDVCHERLALVGVTFLQIGIPLPGQAGNPWPLYDYVVTLNLADIDRVETLQGAALQS